jgi:hypothetical protein
MAMARNWRRRRAAATIRSMRSRLASLVLAVATICAGAAPAAARSERTLAYPREQAWPAAVRFLVVDERLKVIDKDGDAGYVVFELRDEGKTFRGSLEVIAVIIDGRPVVRFVVAIEDRPSWQEIGMLNRLERKLRVELGSPAPAPTRPREPGKDAPKEKEAPRPPADVPRTDDGGPPISPTP